MFSTANEREVANRVIESTDSLRERELQRRRSNQMAAKRIKATRGVEVAEMPYS